MAAVVAYALRRTSARLVVVLAIGGLVWTVWRAVRPAGRSLYLVYLGLGPFSAQSATRWDLAAAALGLVVALSVAAALWFERSARR